MKTNQVIIRPMGNFKVSQRTKDGMFNATELLKQWNEKTGMKKEVTKFFEIQSTSELVSVIMERENLNTQDFTYLKTRGKNGGTWMHPILFIDFAMWINPSFKYDVLKFVYDQLIQYRNDAGDAYPEMCRAVASIISRTDFKDKIAKLSRSLNMIVYGRHETSIRNSVGEESKIRELLELEKNITQWIRIGLVKSEHDLRTTLNKIYLQKYQLNPLLL